MPIEFTTYERSALVQKRLSAVRQLAAGQNFKLELDEEDFEATVPEGKVWGINVIVTVDETDA